MITFSNRLVAMKHFLAARSLVPAVAAMLALACNADSTYAQNIADETEQVERPAIQAGFAETDITPRIGMERPGNYFKQFHVAFHDSCKVRAAVFDDGEKAVALVGIDALLIRGPQVEAAREQIFQQLAIEPERILIAATHSHSSGPTGMLLPGEFEHADEFVQRLAYEESTLGNPDYLELVVRQIVSAVVTAHQTRKPVRVGFGAGHEDSVVFNRRFRMRNNRTYTTPRQGNPDTVEPAGPIDPQVGVIGVWGDKDLVGCIVNFSCHATTSPPAISANYVYYLEKQIRSMLGEDVVVLFLAGASGDTNATDNLSPYLRVSGDAAAKLVGSQVGAEAVKQLLLMGTTDQVSLAGTSKILKIPRRQPTAERVAQARHTVQETDRSQNATDWIFAKETILVDALIAKEPIRDVEIQVIQLGPAVFVTTPAEYFCQYGLDQREAIHFPLTFPVSLANDCVGYVPTEDAFGPQGGGYETRLTSYSNLITTAGRQMANTGIALANSLVPDSIPVPPLAHRFSEAWSYGSVPPEVE